MNVNFGAFGNYNNLEYFELIWHYERLVEYRKQENLKNEQPDGQMSLGNMSQQMFQSMQGEPYARG